MPTRRLVLVTIAALALRRCAAAAGAQTAPGSSASLPPRRSARSQPGTSATAATRQADAGHQEAIATAPTEPSIRRVPARTGRQAAHRGLQGRAALAVGAGPPRRQDHAAAHRRHARPPACTPIELRDRSRPRSRNTSPTRSSPSSSSRRSPRMVYVMGEVTHPGTMQLHGPTTMLQALAMAGGFKEFANTKDIRVLRRTPRGMQTISFNYKDGRQRRRQAGHAAARRHGHRSVEAARRCCNHAEAKPSWSRGAAAAHRRRCRCAGAGAARRRGRRCVTPGWVFTPTVAIGATYDDNSRARRPRAIRTPDDILHDRASGRGSHLHRQAHCSSAAATGDRIQRYRTLDQFDRWHQRGYVEFRQQPSRRVSLFVRDNVSVAPSTDLVNVRRRPVLAHRTRSNDFDARGSPRRSTKKLSVAARYHFQWVEFDRHDVPLSVLLRGGRSTA